MTPGFTVSRLPICHCASTLVALAMCVAATSSAPADEKKGEAHASAQYRSSTPALPGRIYAAMTRTPPAGGTRWETVSFDPNTGERKAESVPLGDVVCLRVSPLGTMAAYWRLGYRDYRDVAFVCPLDGSSKEVSLLPEDSGRSLTWAPDGKRVLVQTWGYEAVNGQGVLRMQTWLVNADGSGRTRFPIPDTHEVVDWSADGKSLLTTVPPRTQPRPAVPSFPCVLYVMRPDGTVVRRVTPEAEESYYGRFSPDSARIAYFRSVPARTQGKCGISVVTLNGTDRKEVVHATANGVPAHMCWSPDGKCLAGRIWKGEKTLFGVSWPSESWIDICDLNGNKVRTLTAPEDENGSFLGRSIDWR